MRVQTSKIFKLLLLAICTLQLSCVQGPSTKRASDNIKAAIGEGGSDGSGQGAGADDGTLGDGSIDLSEGRAELRHIVDPFEGTFKTKVTIPKNFTGYLHLSGLNITSLSDRIIRVRFNFGREMEPIIVNAAVGRAPGITPQTDIEVLTLDMTNKPFENVRLMYDLYDYNKYDTDGDGVEDDEEFTDDPRDGGLYCRGLKLEHDPTFQGSASNNLCDAANEKCNYAYAKIVDSGLINQATGLAELPSNPQVDIDGNGYTSDSSSNALLKCLPDSPIETSVEGVLNSVFAGLSYGSTTSVGGSTYIYRGPYRVIGETSWEISGGAIVSAVTGANPQGTGLFQSVMAAGNNDSGVRSFLFPRAGVMDLNSNLGYFGSANHYDTDRGSSAKTLLTAGDSLWMDGCNMRASQHDSYTNEGIASCNVTATIELITTDPINGGDIVLFPQGSELGASTEIKLQLVRPSLTDYQGREVLASALKTCSSSSACGSQECCYNNRCWSKDLVSQCIEDVPGEGNLDVGESCSSDFQCSSLCCNGSFCKVHVNTDSQQALCSKSAGQTCIAKEWCAQQSVQNCIKVKNPAPGPNQPACSLRCYNVMTFGDCKNGLCQPPTSPPVPTFDPTDPNNCNDAVDPPQN